MIERHRSSRLPVDLTVLLVDDDCRIHDAVKLALDELDVRVLCVGSGRAALETLRNQEVHLVFLDLRLPDVDGMDLLKDIRLQFEETPVVMLTATDSSRLAVRAIKVGAHEYLTKPFDPEDLVRLVRRAQDLRRMKRELLALRRVQSGCAQAFIGESDAVLDLHRLIRKTAPTDATILIQGESGTGKEMIARAIHDQSGRRDRPFIPVNCAAIPETLLESEMFGFERGAFTGADRQKLGRVELAHEGTLFLDEVSSLRLEMQGKLLRVLQEREFERLGGTRTVHVDMRVIAATNTDLKKMAQEGRFREDLYYRLQVIPISVPPLRRRRMDIPLLAEHFLHIFAKRFGKKLTGFDDRAVEYLTRYDWPGNVRELEHLVERLVALAEEGQIDVSDLPLEILLGGKPQMTEWIGQSILLKDARDEFERGFIQAILDKSGGNQTRAAEAMGVHRNTLVQKIRDLGLRER